MKRLLFTDTTKGQWWRHISCFLNNITFVSSLFFSSPVYPVSSLVVIPCILNCTGTGILSCIFTCMFLSPVSFPVSLLVCFYLLYPLLYLHLLLSPVSSPVSSLVCFYQCCGSETIYSGSISGSKTSFEFSKFWIRIQAKVPETCGSGSNL